MKLNFDPVTHDPPLVDVKFPASVRTFTLDSQGSKLIGSILIAAGEGPHPTVIFLTGFPGNDTNMDFAHAVRRSGFNVVHFHYRGSWGSGGNYTWSNCIEDSKFVINYFRSEEVNNLYRCDNKKVIPIGHSMGGFITLLNLANDDLLTHGVSFAGFNYGLWADFIKSNDEIKNISLERMRDSVQLLNGTSEQDLLDEMLRYKDDWNLISHAETLAKKDLLLIAAKYDQLAPIELHHFPLSEALKKYNSNYYEKIIACGHSFSDKRIELTREIINWLNKIEV